MSLHCHARPTPHTEDPSAAPAQEEGSDTGSGKADAHIYHQLLKSRDIPERTSKDKYKFYR